MVIDDTGGQWAGWPLVIVSVVDDDKSIVRTGGLWPYKWDAGTSQQEAVANARLIAAAPDLAEALADVQDKAAALVRAVLEGDKREMLIAADALNVGHPKRYAALAKARGVAA